MGGRVSKETACPMKCDGWHHGYPMLCAMDRERFFRTRNRGLDQLGTSPFAMMKYCPWCGSGLIEVEENDRS